MDDSKFCSCFVFSGSFDWKKSSPDDWDLDVIQLDGTEKLLGHKQLDGSTFKIMQTHDKIIAVTK